VNNPSKEPLLLVTNSGPKPGDFPIGSVESRAAARGLAEHKTEVKKVLRVDIEHMWERGPGKLPPELPADTRYETETCIVEIVNRLAW
jgi:hypothetical protein